MDHPSRLLGLGAAAAAAVLWLGCGPANPLGRRAVSGRITLDGQPLAQGNIRFEPLDPKGIATGGVIAKGEFSIAKDKGLPPGKYRVRVFSSEAAPSGPGAAGGERPAPGAELPGREIVPAKYNTASEVIHEVTAAGGGEFVLDMRTQ